MYSDKDPNKEALGVRVDVNNKYSAQPGVLRYMDDTLLAGVQAIYLDFVKNELTDVVEKR